MGKCAILRLESKFRFAFSVHFDTCFRPSVPPDANHAFNQCPNFYIYATDWASFR